jgi:hypothetical protein
MPDKKKSINEFSINTSEIEILEALEWRCNQDNTTPSNFRELEALYLTQLLNNINQQKLLDSQNDFNKKIIKQNKLLVIAAWIAIIVSITGLFVSQKIYINSLKTSQLEVEKNGHGLRIIPGSSTSTVEYY